MQFGNLIEFEPQVDVKVKILRILFQYRKGIGRLYGFLSGHGARFFLQVAFWGGTQSTEQPRIPTESYVTFKLIRFRFGLIRYGRSSEMTEWNAIGSRLNFEYYMRGSIRLLGHMKKGTSVGRHRNCSGQCRSARCRQIRPLH
jgi:hypothetical protein